MSFGSLKNIYSGPKLSQLLKLENVLNKEKKLYLTLRHKL